LILTSYLLPLSIKKNLKPTKHETMKVSVRKSWMTTQGIKSSEFTLDVKDIQNLFYNVVFDAQYMADTAGGSIKIERTKTSLYISYDIPGQNIIDIQYLVNS